MKKPARITDKMRLDWLNKYMRRTQRWADILPVICESDPGRKTCYCNDSDIRKTLDTAIRSESKEKRKTQ